MTAWTWPMTTWTLPPDRGESLPPMPHLIRVGRRLAIPAVADLGEPEPVDLEELDTETKIPTEGV